MHQRNKHKGQYDFDQLIACCPELAPHVALNKHGNLSINFFDNNAVKLLNKALLQSYYGVKDWDIPTGYLCPPIPGRADYIHSVADLLASYNKGIIPTGNDIVCLDIGVGANCVYPLIGHKEYDWSFIGSDIDKEAIKSGRAILKKNPKLESHIDLRWQSKPQHIFDGIIRPTKPIDLIICNPPFHTSKEEAKAGSLRKLTNLKKEAVDEVALNFAGKSTELYCDGGEKKFISTMIKESQNFKKSCFWFSTLVSQSSHLRPLDFALKKAKASRIETIDIVHGNKKSRILAWTFLSKRERAIWAKSKWRNEELYKYEYKPKDKDDSK